MTDTTRQPATIVALDLRGSFGRTILFATIPDTGGAIDDN